MAPDYLKTVHSTVPSFHHRVGKLPVLPEEAAPENPANSWGFPQPGTQSPSPAVATAKHYFVDDTTWDAILGRLPVFVSVIRRTHMCSAQTTENSMMSFAVVDCAHWHTLTWP